MVFYGEKVGYLTRECKIFYKKYEDSKTDEQKLNDILIQNPKKVNQYDKDMNLIAEYPSINNAAKLNNLSYSNISKCCNNKVISVGGYIWRFGGDLTPPNIIIEKVFYNMI